MTVPPHPMPDSSETPARGGRRTRLNVLALAVVVLVVIALVIVFVL